MDLTHFPMDSQLCTLEIESYGYTMADLVYNWKEGEHSVEVRYSSITLGVEGVVILSGSSVGEPRRVPGRVLRGGVQAEEGAGGAHEWELQQALC